MFDGRWRTSVDRAVAPVGSGLRRTGISADALTATGLVVAVGAAVAIGSGHLLLGLVLLVASALPDLLDGAVAKAGGTSSPRGAFFDSVADRASDALVLGGVAWHLASTRGGQSAVLPLAVLALSSLISYQRAKAESLGYVARGGVMERAERIVVLCVGLAFGALLVPVLWLMLALTAVTSVQRFVKVWRQASSPRPAGLDRRRLASGLDARAARWRSWRASAVQRSTRRAARRSHGSGSWRRRVGTRP